MFKEAQLKDKSPQELAETILALQTNISEFESTLSQKYQSIQHLNENVQHLNKNIHGLNKTITQLMEQLRLNRYNRFASQSERQDEDTPQLRLFDEAEVSEYTKDTEVADESITVASSPRKKGRKPLPAALPREQVIYDLTDADKVCPCGQDMTCIGDETSEQLEIIPAKFYVIEHIRKKYACKACESTVRQAKLPKQPIPKSLAAPGMLAHMLVAKYQDHLPLYRQEQILKRLGVELTRATLSNWTIKCAQLLNPLVKLMQADIQDYDVAYADETTVQVLKEPDRAPEARSYMWCVP